MPIQGALFRNRNTCVRVARKNNWTAQRLARSYADFLMTEATAQDLLDNKLDMDSHGNILPGFGYAIFLLEYHDPEGKPVKEHLGFSSWGVAIQHTVLLEANGCKHVSLTNRDLTFDCDSGQVLDTIVPPSSSRLGLSWG